MEQNLEFGPKMRNINKNGGAVNRRIKSKIHTFASQTLKFSHIVLLNEQNRQHFPIYVRKVEIKVENKFTINGIWKLISLLGNVSEVR